jgi:hypothetical protein
MGTYRNPRWALVTQTFLMSAMALIGLSIAIQPGSAGHPGTAPGYIAFGGVIVAVFVFLIVCQLTNRLVVTEQGLTWRSMMRTKSVAWADVQDVLTVTASSVGRWSSPAVKANGKLIRINSVIASRRRIESIVTDIRRARVEVVSG